MGVRIQMGQVRKRTSRKILLKNSLKWRILFYMPVPILLALVGVYQIGYAVNDWQAWYEEYVFTGSSMDLPEDKVDADMIIYDGNRYTVYEAEDGVRHYVFHNINSAGTPVEKIGYWLITFSQVFLTTLWVGLCLFAGGYVYYKREMEKSVHLLLNSADKIANNCLDFTMEKTKPNELGMVCDAFEKMRCSLYETSQENFRILEERRRLNAAFAHDMRNPVTVLKGYIDLLERYIPEQHISREKEMEIIGMVHGQVLRLENYVQKMSSVQKLEDITPVYENVDCGELFSLCTETELELRVEDNGGGFSKEALKLAGNPFYREENGKSAHFGLGLYICKLICGKCGGSLRIENASGGSGGVVTAVFGLSEN